MDNYITKIELFNFLTIDQLSIDLDGNNRQHLIITGKNGSGKTRFISALAEYLAHIIERTGKSYYETLEELEILKNQKYYDGNNSGWMIDNLEEQVDKLKYLYNGVNAKFNKNLYDFSRDIEKGETLVVYFDSKRSKELNMPKSIRQLGQLDRFPMKDRANALFIQYLVNLKADRAFSIDEGDKIAVKKIDEWFNRLEKALASVFDVTNLELRFDRKKYDFDIVIDNIPKFKFNTLSDGFYAIIGIVSELIMRMELQKADAYDLEGIVIIDEIETHLHIDLQKEILPFLIGFFPKIQFIVTTHSPFVMTSVSNATVCDLEKKIVTTDLSNYSYDAIIESYFGSDKYSKILKQKVERFEFLSLKDELSSEENWELHELKDYMASAPKHLALELQSKLLEINLNVITKNKK